jgi:hypothetical protein
MKTYNLIFTKQQLDVIWTALNEMPVKLALSIMQDIERQLKLIEDAGKSNIDSIKE